ncbi:U1 snRNP-specific protein C [Handroanthus impetiginosus]|uniref:U1 snRNP-specific protein C n=1 Tax=Handroanthus impetiginosus TaxID=429701 RepID=A0A2G9I7N4_9LAMI|nr:U1 snRNP-specific protein C [Handroanthus impetiginosus]
MPLGKYYCDYCDKQFQDTPAARRRHLQGVVHQRAKALWYDAVRSSAHLGLDQVQDPQSIGKGICNRFVRTGSCQYGDSCKYYHPKKNVPNMDTQGTEGTSFVNNAQSQGIPGSLLHGEASLPAVLFGNQMGASLGNLPPSLWPPPEGGYPPLPFIDWG